VNDPALSYNGTGGFERGHDTSEARAEKEAGTVMVEYYRSCLVPLMEEN